MAMKFTQIPVDTFEKLQLNAGMLLDDFEPSTGIIGRVLGATTGGISFASNPSFSDFGEDIDNCPNNMLELKRLESFDPQMSGNFLTCDGETIRDMLASADLISEDSVVKVVPRSELKTSDFKDVWWVGDYSDKNSGATAGFIAIHMMNVLNTSGFQIKSEKNAKGQFAFEYHAHYSMDAQAVVPFEIYVYSSGELSPSILLNKHSITIKVGDDITLTAETVPADASVSWVSSATTYATVTAAGLVHGSAEGSTIITASITDSGVTYSDTCTVIVEAAE